MCFYTGAMMWRCFLAAVLASILAGSEVSTATINTDLWVRAAIMNVDPEELEDNIEDRAAQDSSEEKSSGEACMTFGKEEGLCVFYFLCNDWSDLRLIEVDDGEIDSPNTEAHGCPHYLEYCCTKENIANSTDTDYDNYDTDDTDETDNDVGEAVSHKVVAPVWAGKATMQPAGKKTSGPECGWSNPGATPLVIRSSDVKITYASYGDFPWMVALLKKSNSTVWSQEDYLGGGTLIHPSVVMSVAHKMTIRKKMLSADELKCRAGEWDTQTEGEIFPHQERDVDKYIIHEDYYRPSLYNDIVLLFLKSEFSLKNAPHIGTGCLASAPPVTTTCYSMGWGKEFQNKKQYSVVLKKVPLNIVPSDTCQDLLRQSRLGPMFELHESLICAAGKKDVDTCRGDGGSPLVCPISNDPDEMRYAVYGMVAYGLACGDPKTPGTYTNVVKLKSWVDSTMEAAKFETTTYTV